MRFHCYLQHILKVRILICSQRGAWKSYDIHQNHDTRFHIKTMKMKIENSIFYRHHMLMILSDFKYHFWCQNGGPKTVQNWSEKRRLIFARGNHDEGSLGGGGSPRLLLIINKKKSGAEDLTRPWPVAGRIFLIFGFPCHPPPGPHFQNLKSKIDPNIISFQWKNRTLQGGFPQEVCHNAGFVLGSNLEISKFQKFSILPGGTSPS